MRIRTVATLFGAAAFLTVAAPAAAQDEPLMVEVGAGIVHVELGGFGFHGAIVKSLRPMGSGMLQVVGIAGLARFDGLNIFAAGAGPRMTFTPRGKMTPYAQALIGIAHRGDIGDTAFGLAPGAGVIVAHNDRFDIVAGADLAIVHNTFGTSSGIRISAAIQLPLSSR